MNVFIRVVCILKWLLFWCFSWVSIPDMRSHGFMLFTNMWESNMVNNKNLQTIFSLLYPNFSELLHISFIYIIHMKEITEYDRIFIRMEKSSNITEIYHLFSNSFTSSNVNSHIPQVFPVMSPVLHIAYIFFWGMRVIFGTRNISSIILSSSLLLLDLSLPIAANKSNTKYYTDAIKITVSAFDLKIVKIDALHAC